MLGELACDVGMFACAGAAVVRASEAPTAATRDASRFRQVRRVDEFTVFAFFEGSSIGSPFLGRLSVFQLSLALCYVKQSQEGSSPITGLERADALVLRSGGLCGSFARFIHDSEVERIDAALLS